MRSFLLSLVVVLLFSATATPAFAQKRREPRWVNGFPTLIDASRDVRMPGNLGAPVPFDPWNAKSVKARYGFGEAGWLLGGVQYWAIGAFDFAMDDFDNDAAERIAHGCMMRYPGDGWSQIHCAAKAVNMTLDAIDYGEGGADGPGLRSFCRDHQRALEEVFDELDLPNVGIDHFVMDGHVVAQIFVVGADSPVYRALLDAGHDPTAYPFNMALLAADTGTYQYILDAGWDPGRIWPYNAAAKAHHDRNGDGVTEVKTLPAIAGMHPVPREVVDAIALRKSLTGLFDVGDQAQVEAAMRGLNVRRYQRTKSIVTVPHTGSAASSPNGGGISR